MAVFIAHRGESHDAPENTLAAFKLANERDTDGMECDIRLTADKVLVCNHDASTLRRSGVEVMIESTNLQELQKVDVSGGADAFDGKYAGEPVPTFYDSLLTLKPGRTYYVEIKGNDEAIIPAMRADVERAGVPYDQIVIITFHNHLVPLCKKLFPEVKTLWLTSMSRDENGNQTRTPEEIFATLEELGADGLDIGGRDEFLTPEFLREVKAKGYILGIWTVDDIDRCKYFVSNGVDAITSNCAAKMKALCAN